MGSSAFIGSGSEKAAQVTGDVVGHTSIAGSEIRAFEPMILL